jgi:hypothetical protein
LPDFITNRVFAHLTAKQIFVVERLHKPIRIFDNERIWENLCCGVLSEVEINAKPIGMDHRRFYIEWRKYAKKTARANKAKQHSSSSSSILSERDRSDSWSASSNSSTSTVSSNSPYQSTICEDDALRDMIDVEMEDERPLAKRVRVSA